MIKKYRDIFNRQLPFTRYLCAIATLEFFYLLAQYFDSIFLAWSRIFLNFDYTLSVFKFAGFLPIWIIVASGLFFYDRRKNENDLLKKRRGLLLFLSAFFAMLGAEILKIIIRRERPQALLDFLPTYRDWSGNWWENNDLGMPSSHTATAFGAAFALCYLFPRYKILWLILAIGCALSRIVQQAHTLTDVYVAAILALVIFSQLKKRLTKTENLR